jgi:hypothetical protein
MLAVCISQHGQHACVSKESALTVTAKQQAAGTDSFTGVYDLHAYTAFGLFIASRVSADSKLAYGSSQSCLWFESCAKGAVQRSLKSQFLLCVTHTAYVETQNCMLRLGGVWCRRDWSF